MSTKLNKSEHQNTSFPKVKNLILFFTTLMLTLFLGNVNAQEGGTVVRLAKLQIDTSQLEAYKVALKEEIETSIRVEPGVLTLYAVSDKDNPTLITIFEIYADVKAYEAHRESPHFKKYKIITKEMVKSLDLTEAVPLLLEAKPARN
jgi:quinol monooxygenase YgiN